jgi:uncharacterized protein (TIGR00369 family)
MRYIVAHSTDHRRAADIYSTAMDLSPNDINNFVAEVFPATVGDGVSCVETGNGYAIARLAHDPVNVRPGGIVPGPSIFGLADAALWYAVFTRVGREAMAVTSDMTIHFLRPAVGASLLGKCTLTKVGKRLAHGEIRIWEEGGDPDRLVAFPSGAYALPD